MERWTADRITDQTGRTFIVTGANSGLGFETARQLAAHGGRVVLTARSESKGADAVGRIKTANPGAIVEYRLLDLADLDSVHRFAGSVQDDGIAVDVLVNNAGVMMPPRQLSPQGSESQFATNHLGHFALSGLLFGTIAQGRDPRIVTVSSTLHRNGSIHFDDLTGERSYSPTRYYSQSKFANVLFGLELDRRLRAIRSPVRSVLAHPGYSDTNLQTSGPTGAMRQLLKLGNRLFAQQVEMGALNQLYAAVAPGAESGKFYGPDGFAENRGYPKEVQPTASAKSEETAKRLWTLSEELTGVIWKL
ncbi:MAG TPA: oxidoreductase [Actinocrinis sp.]|uniref:oxidoreductase n=1 Tax=Actinocrinis sp. TaxID=1920516 RepID=UPI002DDD8D46|nr:oxidoreductase [Actinocrinis sp.]HEV2345010.1 oxidoreductase [Actinocrinis sp.]